MDELIKPKIEEEKDKMLQQVKDEAVENAIIAVKQRIKEQMDAEAAAKEETTEEEPHPTEKEGDG
jgi:F0F1-type ATP synthase membrane subunit b/b'